MITGINPPEKKKCIDSERIFKLVTNYQETNILLYLKGLANNVSFKITVNLI
jgi:hypothetical protein